MDKNINFKVGLEFFTKGISGIAGSLSNSDSGQSSFASDIAKGNNIEEESKKV
jgi:hypothetical protein